MRVHSVLDEIAPVLAFLVWAIALLVIWRLLDRVSRYEYEVADGVLEIRFWWAGWLKIRRRLPLSKIYEARRVRSVREIIPIVNGKIPTLLGRFTPSQMLLISRGPHSLFPLLITPPNPDDFLLKLTRPV